MTEPSPVEALIDRQQRVDEAVRTFRRLNPMRWRCACIGCVYTMRRIFGQIEARQALSPSHNPEIVK